MSSADILSRVLSVNLFFRFFRPQQSKWFSCAISIWCHIWCHSNTSDLVCIIYCHLPTTTLEVPIIFCSKVNQSVKRQLQPQKTFDIFFIYFLGIIIMIVIILKLRESLLLLLLFFFFSRPNHASTLNCERPPEISANPALYSSL